MKKGRRMQTKASALLFTLILMLGLCGTVKAEAAQRISTVAATYDKVLLHGTRIADLFTADAIAYDTSKMTLTRVSVYDYSTRISINSVDHSEYDNTFVTGRTYRISLNFVPKDGYEFALTGATINGTPGVIENRTTAADIEIDVVIPEPVSVSGVVAVTIPEPVVGEAPVNTGSVTESYKDKASVSGVTWFIGNTTSVPLESNGGKFLLETSYTASVALKPAPGYVFSDAFACTVNGKPAVWNSENGRALYTTQTPEKQKISAIDIMVETPVAEQAPTYTASLAESQESVAAIDSVYWYFRGMSSASAPVAANGGKFKKGLEHTVVIKVKVKDADTYKLAENVVCTVNGQPAVWDAVNKQVKYSFPILDAQAISSVALNCELSNTTFSSFSFGDLTGQNYSVDTDSVKWSRVLSTGTTAIDKPTWSTAKIDPGYIYKLEFSLVPKDGFGFTENTANDIKVPDNTEITKTINVNTGNLLVSITYKKKLLENIDITLVPLVGSAVPAVGTKLACSNEHCTAEVYKWERTDGETMTSTLEAGVEYAVALRVIPEDGYALYDYYNVTDTKTEQSLLTASTLKQRLTLNGAAFPEETSYIAQNAPYIFCFNIPVYSHTHSYADAWSWDESSHWHACSCGAKSGLAEHTYDAGVVTTPATCQTDGVKTFTCTVCGYTKTEAVTGGSHSYDAGTVTKQATQTESGIKTYRCVLCGTTRTEVIAATGKKQETVVIRTGDRIKVSGAYYVVGKGKTVTYKRPANKKSVNVKIPATVRAADGKLYKVTAIAKDAFKNNKNLKKVTIGKNVTSIGDRAFYGCKKLKTITVNTKLLKANKIGKKAFSGIAAKATVKVPKKKFKAYKSMLRKKGVGKKATFKKI